MKQLFNEIREGIAATLMSDDFPILFGITLLSFLVGLLLGFSSSEDLNKKQCNEMSITEALQYPYCRTYFQKEMDNMEE